MAVLKAERRCAGGRREEQDGLGWGKAFWFLADVPLLGGENLGEASRLCRKRSLILGT